MLITYHLMHYSLLKEHHRLSLVSGKHISGCPDFVGRYAGDLCRILRGKTLLHNRLPECVESGGIVFNELFVIGIISDYLVH